MSRFHRMAWAALGLGLLGSAGCAHTPARVVVTHESEAEKCQLVQSVLKEPEPSQLLQEVASEGREEPAPVVVYIRRPEQSLLERFFVGDEPLCGDGTFKVVQDNVLDAVVVYLQEVQDGYAYDAHRAGPQELSMEGKPQGLVKRDGPAWVASPGPI
ncbi:hypothetical protein JY651_08520 [Pyxidicoccus parkwayensis]|uniref:Lipoprotein n=1 Tax=Pyxidicoccus parkwayensis TaxID=2813578 RepID=A0ABX7P3D3_9BACT|nr:hypothetical protein [Pyxidicoccus parkwaysis]QSQ24966.1 hypothetical protein JY651_08520 [Pyxidicoccus parkwaysis]